MAKTSRFVSILQMHAVTLKVRDINNILGPKEELMIGKPIADFGQIKKLN